MKLLNKQIDMISWTSKEGVVTPVRFRIEEDGKSIVVRIGRREYPKVCVNLQTDVR